MVRAVRLENFKSYRKAQLDLAPLTMLVGANASGKSNAIEALQLLAWLAQGHRLGEIQSSVGGSDRVLRGEVTDLGYDGNKTFSIGCLGVDPHWSDFQMDLRYDGEGLRVAYEHLASPSENFPLYRVEQPAEALSHDLRVAYNNFARGGKKPQIVCSDQMAVFTQLGTPARFGATHKKAQQDIPRVADCYRERLGQTLFLDPVPSNMRDYTFANERHLVGDGRNLSSVLFNLWKRQENRRAVLNLISSLPEQEITNVEFLKTPREEVMVSLVETFGGRNRSMPAPLLSDGTLRVLAVAAALLSAPEGSMVVIEEIDNGVHPSRAGQLLSEVQALAERRQLRVLLTTHNPTLLDELPNEAMGDVVFCYRSPENGDSRLVKLEDLGDYPELVAQGPLGELMTQGVLDRFVKQSQSPGHKKYRLESWLAEIEKESVA